MAPGNAATASMTMLRMATGSWVSQAIYVAAKLGVADLLEDGPRSHITLANAAQAHPGALYRLLRALASLDVFAEDTDGRFCLTPLADCLRTTAPGSLRAFAIMLGEQEHWRAWGDALHSVRTGQPAFDHVFGVPHFKYLAEHPEAARRFNEGMTSRSGQENDAIIGSYDFSGLEMVVDVGGGEGTLLAAILKASDPPRGLLFDLPHVIAAVRAGMAHMAKDERLQFEEGDFFDVLPAGGDAYVLKKVIHDWDDERSMSILENCRRAMPKGARLLLIEPLVPPGNAPSFNKLLDLLMLVWTSGGKERTEAEHRTLLASAGFEPIRVMPTNSPLSIIEAVPQA